jgi:hypothetical protein
MLSFATFTITKKDIQETVAVVCKALDYRFGAPPNMEDAVHWKIKEMTQTWIHTEQDPERLLVMLDEVWCGEFYFYLMEVVDALVFHRLSFGSEESTTELVVKAFYINNRGLFDNSIAKAQIQAYFGFSDYRELDPMSIRWGEKTKQTRTETIVQTPRGIQLDFSSWSCPEQLKKFSPCESMLIQNSRHWTVVATPSETSSADAESVPRKYPGPN